jgi:hypothetical protein
MTDEHERYEQLAVGHVLGGLVAGEAADFRDHLLACRDCRSRVAELRGIAADLAAAERDERTRSRLRTEAPRRVEQGLPPDTAEPGAHGRVTVRHVTVGVVVVVFFAAAMAFWNLHLRTLAATYAMVAEQRGEILREVADGRAVDADFAAGIGGQVVAEGEVVALNLSGIPTLAVGERLVVWLLDGPEGAWVPALLVRSGQIDDGSLTAILDDRDAEVLVLTRERDAPGLAPSGDELVRASLRGAGP